MALPDPVEHGSWSSAGLCLHYVAWGRADLPLLVIHHGWLDNGRSWDSVAERLADAFRVVAVDARGHGDSEWIGAGGSYYFSDYLLDLHALLAVLSPSEPVHLVGHSMGGSVVGYFAGAFPDRVRSLTVVEGFGPPDELPDLAAARLQAFVATTTAAYAKRETDVMEDLDAAAMRLRRADALLDPARALELAYHATRPVNGGLAWKADPLHRARSGAPFVVEYAKALWRRVTAPTLAVDGGKSAFVWPGLDERRAEVKGLVRLVIPSAGHNVHVNTPGALADAIRAHALARIVGERIE